MTTLKPRHTIKEKLRKLLPASDEEYIPLPPGGFPLPVVVKRKFSFPAQLPNISTLSLLPDFNSTKFDHLDGGLTLGKAHSTGPSVHPLLIRYSLIRPEESAPEQVLRPSTPHPSLRRKAQSIIGSSLSVTEVTISEQIVEDNQSSGSSTNGLDMHSTSNTSQSSAGSVMPMKGRERSGSIAHRSAKEAYAARVASEGKLFLSVKDQIAWKLKRCAPHILRSFHVVDLQFPGHPIAVVSRDLLPEHGSDEEGHYLNEHYPNQVSLIRVKDYNGRKLYSAILQGDLYNCTRSSDSLAYRFVAHIDLTGFVESVRFGPNTIWRWTAQPYDVWLSIAHELMRKQGHTIDDPPLRFEAEKVSRKDQLDIAMDIIRFVHRDFFVLGMSDIARGSYEITHASQSVHRLALQCNCAPDISCLISKLGRGISFYSDLDWDKPRRVYCTPLFGPQLNSWLCFLVDKSLPALW